MVRLPMKLRPRPSTPPDLLLGTTKEEREKFAKDVLQQVLKIERDQNVVLGPGSPWITEADKGKEPPIFEQIHSSNRDIQSARNVSGERRNQGETGRDVNKHDRYYREGDANQRAEWGSSTSRSAPGSFSGLSALPIPAARYYRGAAPKSESEVVEYAVNTFITATQLENATSTAEEQPHGVAAAALHTTALGRWERKSADGCGGALKKQAVDFSGKSLKEVETALSKEKLKALTLAYYCKPGLKYTIPHEFEKLEEKLAEINEVHPHKLNNLGGQIRLSKDLSESMKATQRKSKAASIEHENRSLAQEDYKTGVTRYSAHRAAEIVSDPTPPTWKSSPWVMDHERGEWIRLDQYEGGVGQPKSKYSCYLSEGAHDSRTIINQITFPNPAASRREQLSRAQSPAATRLGGGFGLVSSAAEDPNRPRPSQEARH